jgi:probable addiction module antidote protein
MGYNDAAIEVRQTDAYAEWFASLRDRQAKARINARNRRYYRESLYKALSPEGNPEFATVLKVVRALGLRLHATPAQIPTKQ